MAGSQSISQFRKYDSEKSEFANSPFRNAIENLSLNDKEANNEQTFETNSKSFELELPPLDLNGSLIESGVYAKVQQNWLGHVQNIKDESFDAILIDLTNGGTKEFAEIEIDSVSDSDLPLLRPGAAFYWTISKRIVNGQVSNESFIRFQRLIHWTFDDVNKNIERAEDLLSKINFE